MRQSGWGRIVNVSSVAGVMPQPTGPDYSASKAAINNLSLSLTKALGASGVTVNTVSPGMILTPKLEEVFRQMATTNGWVASDASWEEIERAFLKVSQVPLGRIGRVDEVAHAVVFLCSPLASYITGADLRIHGALVPPLRNAQMRPCPACTARPLYPQERTSPGRRGRSVSCQFRK